MARGRLCDLEYIKEEKQLYEEQYVGRGVVLWVAEGRERGSDDGGVFGRPEERKWPLLGGFGRLGLSPIRSLDKTLFPELLPYTDCVV